MIVFAPLPIEVTEIFFGVPPRCNESGEHLMQHEFCLEILLEFGKDFFPTFVWLVQTLLPGQQPSVAGVCGPIRKTDWLLQKYVTESAPVLSRRAPSTANCQLQLVQSQLLKHYLSLLLVVSVMSEVGQNMYVSTSPECKILSILSYYQCFSEYCDLPWNFFDTFTSWWYVMSV